MRDDEGRAEMIGFTPKHPIVEDLCNGFWRVHEPVLFQAADNRSWIIPENFLTDFGSVPAVVDWIIPANSSKADPAYLLHDLLYARHRDGYPACRDRADADAILHDALLICGVGRVKAWIIYKAVRLGGAAAWEQ